MFVEKFGMLPKKKVSFDGKNITIQKEVIPIEQVKAIYFRPFNLAKNEWGSIYFSLSGNDIHESDLFNPRLVKFTKKQTEKINELLNILEIEVIGKENFSDDRSKKRERAKVESQTVRCPNCQSVNVNFMENQRKGFSVGKAVGGGLLTGGIGTLAGFTGKKGKKDSWHCNDCGFTFERKR